VSGARLEPHFGPPEQAPRKPRRDDRFEATIEGYSAKGRARAAVGSYVAEFGGWLGVPQGGGAPWGAVPGARIEGLVTGRRREQLEARLLRLVEASPLAVAPRCAHFGTCGGCSFQDLVYAAQLEHKQRRLQHDLAALALPAPPTVRAAPAPFQYRNKMDFTFGARRWVVPGEEPGLRTDFALGLHVPGRYEKVLDVHSCAIHFPGADELLHSLRELCRDSGESAYDLRDHRGFWRHAVLRRAHHGGELLVYLVTAPLGEDRSRRAALEQVAQGLLARHPQLSTLVHGENGRAAAVACAERQQVLHGAGRIAESLCGLRFELSAESFFQTNTAAAEGLLAWLAAELAARGAAGGVLHDLYCGTGAIGLVLGRLFERVVGLELAASAVDDARRNARHNGFERAEYHAGDVPALLAAAGDDFPAAQVAVVDPPRAGLHRDLVERLAAAPPPWLVYVSCHPAAAARDLAPLLAGPYAVVAVQGFDLFPHTPHTECVLLLERRDGG
jgi:23S rRNA (uracil1939-C5)-methyltransferase